MGATPAFIKRSTEPDATMRAAKATARAKTVAQTESEPKPKSKKKYKST